MTTDNKAPREWTVVGINQPFQDHLLVLVNGPKVQDGELGFKVIEKSYADKLQLRLEKCETLLRDAKHIFSAQDIYQYNLDILKYFEETEK